MSSHESFPTTAEVPRTSLEKLLAITLAVTAVVTTASYVVPRDYSAPAVACGFLGATWLLVLRKDVGAIRAHGLSIGGLLEPEPIEPKRLLREGARAVLVSLVLLLLIASPFALGFKLWFDKSSVDVTRIMPSWDAAAGQLLVIAFPEEAFYRGYLQTRLDVHFPRTVNILGLHVSLGVVITSAVFAIGHFATIPSPARLAVFFPSLLFGALRKREGGIGAAVLLHAMCNLLSAAVAAGFGGAR